MIFETSRQTRLTIPMAISLGYGILFSTVITLILAPCLFMVIGDVRNALSKLIRARSGGSQVTEPQEPHLNSRICAEGFRDPLGSTRNAANELLLRAISLFFPLLSFVPQCEIRFVWVCFRGGPGGISFHNPFPQRMLRWLCPSKIGFVLHNCALSSLLVSDPFDVAQDRFRA